MDKKGILTKIKELFNSSEEKFEGDYKTQDGRILRVMGGMDVGTEVKEITEEGEVDIEDGNYILEDGMVLEVKEGKITNVMEVENDEEEVEEEMSETEPEEVEEEMSETTLEDGTKVKVEGELMVGSKVMVEKDGEWVKAPEGQHNLSDGRVIYVDAEGMINEIETPTTKKEDEENMSELFSSISKLVDEIKELRVVIKLLQDENTELKTKFNKFSKEPSVEPTTHEIKFSAKMSKEDKIKFFKR